MAYGLKYYSQYRNYDGVVKRVKFYKIDFTGDAIEWGNDKLAVTFSYGDSDSFFPEIPIIASQAKIGFIFEEQYDLSEFVFDRKTFFCEIYNESTSRVEWSGWVEPWNAQHSYSKPPYTATLTVSCGLAHLSKIKYVNPNTTFKKTGLQLIQECLAIMGSQLNLRVSTHMIENSFGGAGYLGLTSFEINTVRYYDENGEAMHCDEIVNDILNKFNAEILQWDNRWVIRAIVDHSTGFETTFIEYPFGGGSTVSLPWPTSYEVNNATAFSLDGGVVRILAPITKYRTEVDLGTQLPYFENGNMLIWTESGLVGWDFSHMAKGNPGWERYYIGTENTLSVIKINGKAPQPYRKKKKKKLIKILLPILTGAIGANLKNKYYDVEPAEYIESSVGNISKGDKTLKISFDYETAAFSGDVLISVILPMEYEPYTTRWLDPGSKNSGLSDEFVLIRVPPVNRENLINRGVINVAGNPNYPSGTTINWTYVVTGVPTGETRKIGGASGVAVENGDLIISKIANPGGTQAAVGASWEVINIRNNVKKGTFEHEIWLDKINFQSPGDNRDIPHQEVYVRFYKLSDEEGKPGDWYKIYNLRGALEGFVASDESSKYATTLERGSKTDEEAETIPLITGDYNPWFSGSMTKPGSQENTGSWRRRTSLNEGFSIYRAMMLDRICMTSRPLDVVEADITLRAGAEPITYLHTLIMKDIDNMRMRIVRFEFQDTSRIVGVTAVEVKYEEVPADQLRQDSYIPGSRTLNTIPGQGDGIYPTKEDSTNGRLSAEDLELTDEELLEVIQAGSRIASPFDGILPLTYTKDVESSDSIDLSDYLLEEFVLENEDQEEEDIFDLTTLVFSVISKPTWISSVVVDGLVVTAVGKPPVVGSFAIELSAYDEESDIAIPVKIPVLSRPKLTIKYTLRDTSGPNPVAAGNITNGSGHMKPDSWDILVQITGHHEGWLGKVSGPDVNIQQTEFPYAIVDATDSATYIIGSDIISEVGIYQLEGAAFRIERLPDYMNLIKRDQFTFTLYDAEYLNKASFFLWGAVSNTLIGPINPNGLSQFTVNEAWDVKMIVQDTEHDAGTSTIGSEVGELDVAVFEQDPAIDDATYFQFGEPRPEFDPSTYHVVLSLELLGVEAYLRTITFTINKRKVQPTGGLKLGSRPTNTTNFDLIAELASEGNVFPLPANWATLCDAVTDPFDWEGFWLYEFKSSSLVEQNVSRYTKRAQFRSYLEPITESEYYAFDELNSTNIGSIHHSPSTFRLIHVRRLGGENGQDIAVFQSDFSFGELTDITDIPVTDQSELNSILPRNAMSFGMEGDVMRLDVRVDNKTIEIEEPNNPLKNHLRLKPDSLELSHFKPITKRAVIGNISNDLTRPGLIGLINSVDQATDDNILTAITVKTYIEQVFAETINGDPRKIVKFKAGGGITESIVSELEGKIGIGTDPEQTLHVNGNILAGQFMSFVASGTAPFVVQSTTKVQNLNSDLLDDHTGAYYLDWNNFTNKPVENHQYVYRGTFNALDVDTLVSGGWYDNGAASVTSTNLPVAKAGFLQVTPYRAGVFNAVTQDYITSGLVDANYGRKFFRVSWNGIYSAWKEYAFRDWVLGLGYSTTVGTVTSVGMSVPTGFAIGGSPVTVAGTLALSFAAGYSLPTTAKQANWDIAYGWGDHASAGYVQDSRNLTINGTSGRISVSGGTQSLAANRTWTVDLATSGVGAGTYRSVTVDVYGRVTGGSNPTTLAGYGITDAVPSSRVITINGVSLDLSANRSWTISTSGLSGSGTLGYFPKFTGSTSIGDSVMRDTGSEINIASGRSFGVEGPAAMRDYLHVWGYASFGTASDHGSLVIHNSASAVAHASTALEIRSTTRGLGLPIMTKAQREAISSPRDGLMVYQNETVGASLVGVKVFMVSTWLHLSWDLGAA